MVKEVRIYVEGGGDRSDTRAAIREGFSKFLSPLRSVARERRIRWTVTACGSRNATFDIFKAALETHPGEFLVLLVDSEDAVKTSSPWEHLRRQDGWDSRGLSDDHCHLMVQMVEAWFLADPNALGRYYGQRFLRGALPGRIDVEAVPKDQLEARLNRATAKTQKGSYAKIRHCADLLALIDRDLVRQRAGHCELLFSTLEAVLRGAARP